MKKFFSFIFLLILLFVVYLYRTDITKYIIYNYIYKKDIKIPESNDYKRDYDFGYIKNTDNFYPNNKQELYNVFYTILNNGYDDFTFYCGKEYSSCTKDIKEITNHDNQTLSTINNYVHPYNSYNTISVNINNLGRVNVKVQKLYTSDDIYKINNEIDKILNQIIKPNMTDKDKIKAIHDYIINNTIYDKKWVDLNDKTARSNMAYGPLFNKTALCGGYTDLMELFLEKINIKSFKIASENHIWNYIYIDNEWKHLDLTWDDPVTNTGKNLLKYDYFLINTIQLEQKKDKNHIYNKNLYIEAQ